MILNLRHRHAGDVILAMPAIQTLRNKGIPITVNIPSGYWGLLKAFDVNLVDDPNLPSIHPIPNIPDRHVTQWWLNTLQTIPTPSELFVAVPQEFSNYIILSPDCRDLGRRIGNPLWRDTIIELRKFDKQLIVVGPSDAQKYNSEFCNEFNIDINLTGKDTPERLISLLKYADCVISTDTATGHLSDAIGTPTITLVKNALIELFHPFWNPRIARRKQDIQKYLEEILIKDTLEDII